MSDIMALEERLRRVRRRKNWQGVARSVLATVAAVYLLLGVIFGIAVVKGRSMEPNIYSGDLLLFSRINQGYERGDIVLLRVVESQEDYLKRIVAVGGDTVDIDGITVALIINGEKVEETHIYAPTREIGGGIELPLTVPKNSVFVLGDNRMNSEDSRLLGTIPVSEIEGKALCIFRRRIF